MKKRLIIGVSGASGTIYAVRMLELLRDIEAVETHLIISKSAAMVLTLETDYALEEVKALADVVYRDNDLAAVIASGSFKTAGMIVVPCSIKSLSGIANAYSDSLLLRAADVTLKEHRILSLMIREAPLHRGHLKLMLQAADIGARIVPPSPYFYTKPKTIMDLVDQSVGRVLDMYDIEIPGLEIGWQGMDLPDDG